MDGADDGELFLEYRQAEALTFDNGRLKQATYDTAQGFGLRAVKAEAVGYAHASDLSEAALARAAEAVRAVNGGHSGSYAEAPGRTNRKLYADDNPLGTPAFDAKVKLLEKSTPMRAPRNHAYGRSPPALPRPGRWWKSCARTAKFIATSVRWCASMSSVVAGEGDRQETGSYGFGGREGVQRFIDDRCLARRGRRSDPAGAGQSRAVPAPAGEMDVVLGSGWPGVMLHEAVGHGLEGDFNRKKTSAFAGLMGKQVAAKGVTVVDDGTMQHAADHCRSTMKARRPTAPS